MKNNISKCDLFLKLAKPNENGISRWVFVTEFNGDYISLKLGNGASWCRKSSTLQRKYIVEFNKKLTSSNSIDAIRLNGYNTKFNFKQNIRTDIKNFYKNDNCVIMGINGNSENTIIEIDHKNGQKNEENVSNIKTQNINDFQPMCKAANDVKREICKKCIKTNIRWDARNLKGFPTAYWKGGKELSKYGCIGCYWEDPIAYRKYVCKSYINKMKNNVNIE